ncbi:MAG: hypothetical protein JXQ29_11010 [Planctomycetes bacterium]|nr:hypothetical protein [Planctomycetota bacterium]
MQARWKAPLCLAVLFGALLAAGAASQDKLTDVLAVFPPPPTEQSPPGTEKFIVFGRDGDLASAWEYLPGTASLVKRCDFARSSFPPLRLHEGLPVTVIHVRTRTGRKPSNRYFLVDFRTWQVKPLDPLLERCGEVMGHAGTGAYLSIRDPATGNNVLHRLDLTRGDLVRMPLEFSIAARLGDYWIVHYEDAGATKRALFDTRTEKVVESLRLPPPLCGLTYERSTHPATSSDGRYVAWMTGLDWNVLWKLPQEKVLPLVTGRLPSSVVVHDLETGNTVVSPLWFLGRWVSAGWTAHHASDIRFLDAEHLTYLSVGETPHTDFAEAVDAGHVERVVIELESGEVTRTKATKGERPGPEKRLEEPDAPGIVARSERIEAFLVRHGMLADPKPFRTHPNAFTADGQRFLACVRDAGFFAGDFQKDKVTRVDGGGASHPIIHAVCPPR